MYYAIQDLARAGILLVVAAGNGACVAAALSWAPARSTTHPRARAPPGADGVRITGAVPGLRTYPAAFAAYPEITNMLVVAATDINDRLTSFSNRGRCGPGLAAAAAGAAWPAATPLPRPASTSRPPPPSRFQGRCAPGRAWQRGLEHVAGRQLCVCLGHQHVHPQCVHARFLLFLLRTGARGRQRALKGMALSHQPHARAAPRSPFCPHVCCAQS